MPALVVVGAGSNSVAIVCTSKDCVPNKYEYSSVATPDESIPVHSPTPTACVLKVLTVRMAALAAGEAIANISAEIDKIRIA
jgi:hypothetical protein